MLIYGVKRRKNTENINSKISKTKNNRIIIQSKCAICGIKKSRFVKKTRSKRIIKKFRLKKTLSKFHS